MPAATAVGAVGISPDPIMRSRWISNAHQDAEPQLRLPQRDLELRHHTESATGTLGLIDVELVHHAAGEFCRDDFERLGLQRFVRFDELDLLLCSVRTSTYDAATSASSVTRTSS